MSCPTCGYTLQKLSVTTNSGGKFDVDHCGRCGGTWFDPYEINRIPYHEVMRLARLTVLPQKSPHILPAHLCPRCHKKLVQYTGESLPKGTKLLRCKTCHGIWAMQKTLDTFKFQQEEKVTEYALEKTVFPSLSVVFVPALFLLLLFFSTFITVTNLQEAKEGKTYAEEQISSTKITVLSPHSVSLVIETKTPLKSTIFYGTSTDQMLQKPISQELKTTHAIILTNLRSNALYVYKIIFTDSKGKTYTTNLQRFTVGEYLQGVPLRGYF